MKWMNKLERKLGRFAIPNLMYYVVILYGFGYLIEKITGGVYWQYLSLNAERILHGELWRVLTFILYPPSGNVLMIFLVLYIYYSLGRHLEYAWGTFRFNLYYFSGIFLHVVGALVAYAITGKVFLIDTTFLNLSLFFIYAAVFPEQQFLFMFVIPIKGKWLAWFDAVYFGYTIWLGLVSADGFCKGNAIAAFVSLMNFLIFFLSLRNMRKHGIREVRRKYVYQKEVRLGEKAQTQSNGARHKCHVCGRTELDDPNLEFRYCSKCNGNYEYCQEHLFTHEHIK